MTKLIKVVIINDIENIIVAVLDGRVPAVTISETNEKIGKQIEK